MAQRAAVRDNTSSPPPLHCPHSEEKREELGYVQISNTEEDDDHVPGTYAHTRVHARRYTHSHVHSSRSHTHRTHGTRARADARMPSSLMPTQLGSLCSATAPCLFRLLSLSPRGLNMGGIAVLQRSVSLALGSDMVVG